MNNPYDRKLHLKTFVINYVGCVDSYYCFRIVLRGHLSMDAWAFRALVSEWTLHNARGRHLVGNGFGSSKSHPKFAFENKDGRDCFVLLDRLSDIVMFEQQFPVTGYTPTTKVA